MALAKYVEDNNGAMDERFYDHSESLFSCMVKQRELSDWRMAGKVESYSTYRPVVFAG